MEMIAGIYVFFVFFLLAILTAYLPFLSIIRLINGASRNSLTIIQSAELEDETKQKILLSNSLIILKNSLFIIGLTAILALLLITFLEVSVLIKPLSPSYLTNFLLSISGILISLLSFLSFFLIKKQINKAGNSDYSFSSRLLHRIALQSKVIAEMSFEIDQSLSTKKKTEIQESPIFISGLARSGTTMLMRYFYETGQFRSLTYQDMPFVLMPNLWKKLSLRSISGELKERAHKDGIMVSFESPEAFEEVFWRVFCGDQYIRKERLEIQKTDRLLIQKFRDYVQNILSSADNPSQNRYLSKNNNNILRLNSLLECFPSARIIIPFRDPLQHSLSLLNQHAHFSEVQSNDKFSLHYMNWLGHFEFGLNQKPFHFADDDTFHKMTLTDKMSLDFWLLSWKNYYSYALGFKQENIHFFSYELFCQSPNQVLSALFEELKINGSLNELKPFKPSEKDIQEYDKGLLKDCLRLHEKLIERFQSWYNPIVTNSTLS